MKKILIISIILILWFTTSLSAQKYCGDIHEYLFEQGVELLNDYKYYSEFQAGNPLYNLMKDGSSAEDEMDWVYGYSEPGGPEIDVTGVPSLIEWFLIGYCKTITHFWDADTFDVFETDGHDLVSGFAFGDEFTIHDVQSAITKAYTTLFGYNNEVHFKGFKFDAGCEQMFLTEVGTGIQWGFWSPLQYFDISIESIDDYILNGQAYVSGWYDIGNNLIKYTDPIHVEFSETNYFGEIFRQQYPNLEYSYVGRIIHLIGDMAVPAHVHRDQHPPMPYWVNLNLYWDWDYCDDYEGWDYDDGPIGPTGEGGYLRNRVWLVEDWDAESILENYGGLIARPSECNGEDFIFDLFYSINQVTDVIASDDKPGDWDLHSDHPLDDYPFIEDMFNRLQDSSLYPYFSTGTLQLLMDPHEKCSVNYECDKIRDVCIPLAIRGTASFLEWWAKWNDFTPTWVSYREICCQIIIYSYSGAILPLPDNIQEATVEFSKQGSNEVYIFHPDSEGHISTVFIGDQVGSDLHDVVYDITTYLDEYYSSGGTGNVVINGSEEILEITLVIFKNPVNSISGIVTLSGDGGGCVEDVEVSAGSITVHPETTGYYIIDGLLPDTYEVTALLAGYTIETQDAIVIENEPTVGINFNLMSIVPAGYIFVSHNGNGHYNNIAAALLYLHFHGQLYNTIILDDGYYGEDLLEWSGDDGHLILKSLNGPENCKIFSGWSTVFRFVNCYWSDPSLNGLEGITLFSYWLYSPVISIYNSSGVTIKNCIIYRIFQDNKGIQLGDDSWPYADPCLNIIIVNNTITNATTGISIESGSSASIKNNIIYNNDYAISGGSPTVEYCNIYGNLDDDIWNGNGVIHEDPFFADPDNNDYSLQWNADNFSPCIDTGDPETEWDEDETPPDMGAVPAIPHNYDCRTLNADRWNWFSFPVLDTLTELGTDALNVLAPILDPDILTSVKGNVNGGEVEIIWNGYNWVVPPGMETFQSIDGYKIQMNTDAELPISGFFEQSDRVIYLYADDDKASNIPPLGRENWIGYFLPSSQLWQVAFSQILDKITFIKADDWAYINGYCMPSSLYTVDYGKLYIVGVSEDCSFIWQGIGHQPANPYKKQQTEVFSYEKAFDYMPVFIDSTEAVAGIDEIGIFVDDECIGASKIEGFPVFVPVYIDEDSTGSKDYNELTFQIATYGKSGKISITAFVYNKTQDAFVEEPVILDAKSYAIVRLGTGEGIEFPKEFALYQNYPNPFSPRFNRGSTTISFIPASGVNKSEIKIYNIKGQLVKTIISGINGKSPITNVIWNGKDKNGKFLASGIYFYKLISGDKSAIKKMVILR